MTTDTIREIRASKDFEKLQTMLQDLVGQPCLGAELSYAGELVFHFGEAKPYRHPRMAEKVKGSWILSAGASPWQLAGGVESPRYLFFGVPDNLFARPGVPLSKTHVESLLAKLSGTKVEAVSLEPSPADLAITFTNGFYWVLLSHYAEPELELPAWELQTPNGMYFQVHGHPSPTWSLLRSDLPLRS